MVAWITHFPLTMEEVPSAILTGEILSQKKSNFFIPIIWVKGPESNTQDLREEIINAFVSEINSCKVVLSNFYAWAAYSWIKRS